MINLLVKAIFFVITKLYSIILTPFLAIITALFPSLSQYFNYIITFLRYCFTYVRSILRLLLIPDNAVLMLFNYFAILYTIYITTLTIRFAINLYKKLKP